MAYWLDRLPPQPVLDGFEPFKNLTQRLEECPVSFSDPLPTFDPRPRSSFNDSDFRYSIRDFMEEFSHV